ncbi:RiPP maturation radical SAM C-methyltransferase, partial [Salinarimonas rosea]|uniref:RiPP maturation radical SAM C-methyltransferase n=1 Tax=Salinarimonas rosea TaxID=552063 RepID=UPI00041FE8D5
MIEIKLVDMPFAGMHMPSLGLTQLRSVLLREHGARVRVTIHYLNQDFARYFGRDLYRFLSDDGITTVTGLTDWLFRHVAFPDAPDNTDEFLRRYRRSLALPDAAIDDLLGKRRGIARVLDDLIARDRLDEASIVGFTSMFDQTTASIAMARRLKDRSPGIVTVLGGAACEPAASAVLARRAEPLDFVFAGPALASFPAFVAHRLSGREALCHEIPGVYSRANCDAKRGEVGVETGIDDVLPLDYDDFLASLSEKLPNVEPELFVETSRGCWWGERLHCTFCGLNGTSMTYRSMRPEKALAQFQDLFRRYPGVKRFFAVDNILDPAYFEGVFDRLDAPDHVSIFYETRVIDEDAHLRSLARARVTRIQPGLEALSSAQLKLMGKGSTSFRNVRFLKAVLAHEIHPEWNLLLGFPNEDPDVYAHYLECIPSLVHLPPPAASFPVRFDRYSPYHSRPATFGLDLQPMDFYRLVYPFPDDELADLAYFFSDRNHDNAYLRNLSRWRRHVDAAVRAWIGRWSRGGPRERPVLALAASGEEVVDTRFDVETRHPLEAHDRLVLGLLERPLTERHVVERTGLAQGVARRVLDRLSAARLLFRDGDRMLSLVTP